jgi:hypothetical protein
MNINIKAILSSVQAAILWITYNKITENEK